MNAAAAAKMNINKNPYGMVSGQQKDENLMSSNGQGVKISSNKSDKSNSGQGSGTGITSSR